MALVGDCARSSTSSFRRTLCCVRPRNFLDFKSQQLLPSNNRLSQQHWYHHQREHHHISFKCRSIWRGSISRISLAGNPSLSLRASKKIWMKSTAVADFTSSTTTRRKQQEEERDFLSKNQRTAELDDEIRWREWKLHWWQQLQSIPNFITLTRIACTPVLVYWIVSDQPIYAVAGCLAAGASDFLDGWVAKNYNMSTVLGTYLDPLADKILINSLSVAIWYTGVLPTPIMGIWMAKDVILTVATYRYVINLPPSSDGLNRNDDQESRPSSKRMAMLEKLDPLATPIKVEATLTSKANTVLQFMVLGMSIVHPLYDLDPLLSWMAWTTAGTTVLSLLSYVGYKGLTKSGNLRKEWENGNITKLVKETVIDKNPQKIASLLSKEKEEILKMPRSPIVVKKDISYSTPNRKK